VMFRSDLLSNRTLRVSYNAEVRAIWRVPSSCLRGLAHSPLPPAPVKSGMKSGSGVALEADSVGPEGPLGRAGDESALAPHRHGDQRISLIIVEPLMDGCAPQRCHPETLASLGSKDHSEG
jgi:hypothetical protein